jgi:hypothetical protein
LNHEDANSRFEAKYTMKTMAKAGQGGIEGIAAALGVRGDKAAWNPPFCGDIDMRIAADGTWFYQGSPIGRAGLVKLFASVLRREGERYYLVTPVEKVGIMVDDVPFLAVELEVARAQDGDVLTFRTNVDDRVPCRRDHALRFEPEASGGLRPYVHVRDGLWAKVTRALFYDLVARGEERDVEGRAMFGIASAGVFFPMAEARELREFA